MDHLDLFTANIASCFVSKVTNFEKGYVKQNRCSILFSESDRTIKASNNIQTNNVHFCSSFCLVWPSKGISRCLEVKGKKVS